MGLASWGGRYVEVRQRRSICRVGRRLAEAGKSRAMHQQNLFVQRHLRQHEVRAAIRREGPIHPGALRRGRGALSKLRPDLAGKPDTQGKETYHRNPTSTLLICVHMPPPTSASQSVQLHAALIPNPLLPGVKTPF